MIILCSTSTISSRSNWIYYSVLSPYPPNLEFYDSFCCWWCCFALNYWVQQLCRTTLGNGTCVVKLPSFHWGKLTLPFLAANASLTASRISLPPWWDFVWLDLLDRSLTCCNHCGFLDETAQTCLDFLKLLPLLSSMVFLPSLLQISLSLLASPSPSIHSPFSSFWIVEDLLITLGFCFVF